MFDLLVEFGAGLGWIQVQVVLLDGPPETLNPSVVGCTSLPVHRDLNVLLLKKRGPCMGGVLRPLIRIYDFRTAVPINSFLQYTYAPRRFKSVADSPSEDLSAVDIHDRSEVKKATTHGYVGDVRAPNLVGSSDLQSAQQVGLNEFCNPSLDRFLRG